MSRIALAFKKRKALITFITAGDPSLKKTEDLVYAFEKAGADIIELGIPFSDPLADGPVIQLSHARALKNNVSLSDAFSLVKKVRAKSLIPLVFMLSSNLAMQYGFEKFYSDCGKAGVDGVIMPDMPPEESRSANHDPRVNNIYLIAPTTSDERLKKIAEASAGFIYLISLLGVTGKRQTLSLEVAPLVKKIKNIADKPVALGFGITTPAQAKDAVKYADGVIVGSAIVDLIGQKKFNSAVKLVSKMRKALDD